MPTARPDVHAGLPERDPRANEHAAPGAPAAYVLRDVEVAYGGTPAVEQVTFDITEREITAFIGPSGCGKSTLIRCLNRMNDLIPGASVSGEVLFQGRTSTPRTSTRSRSARSSGWSSRSPTRSPSRSSTTSPSARACSG
jgi:phosphate transport system ATP-binding protein